MMSVRELSALVLFLSFFQCGGSSSALDSFLQGVLRVQQTLPQRPRRNVVKRPGVSLDHGAADLQELQGVNENFEDQAQVSTGLDEASILRELQEVSGSSNLSKRESGDHTLGVAYRMAKLHAESSKGAWKGTGNAASYTDMKQFPVHKNEENSRFTFRHNYGLKNKPADTDSSEDTFVKLLQIPKHETTQGSEKIANNVNEMGLVKIESNRRGNVDGSYETQSGKSEVEEFSASPYALLNDILSESLHNAKHGADAYHGDSTSVSKHKTAAPEFPNAVDKIQPMSNYGSSIEESWKTNDRNGEDVPKTVKDKEDSIFRNENYPNTFNNDNNLNNIQANYEDGEQRMDISEREPAEAEPWRNTHLHETNYESAMVDPYENTLFQDTKLSDSENLRNSMSGVTMSAGYHSPSIVSLIDNSHEAGPKPKSDYLNDKPDTNRLSGVRTLVTKGNSHRNFIRRYPSWDSLAKDRVLNDGNMFDHLKSIQKHGMDEKGKFFSTYRKSKEAIEPQFIQDHREKFIDTDPEILSVHEAYLKYEGGYKHTLGDLVNGELVADIARSIMDKVISDVNLRQHFASGFGSVTKAKANPEKKVEPSAEEVYCTSRCSVERRGGRGAINNGVTQSKCLALPAELKEFLKWMLEGAKEEVHSESQDLLPDKLIFYSASARGAFTPAVTEAQNKSFDPTLKKKMDLVLQLLAEYEQLDGNEKDKVSKVYHYLRGELERLQGKTSEASNATTVKVDGGTTPSPTQKLAKNSTNVEPGSTRGITGYVPETDLIRQELEILGLGENAKLGERLSDRFQYPTEASAEFSPMAPEPRRLSPLIDNSDSVF